jgi:hypothetical protein
MEAAMRLGELADSLSSHGLGLAAVRALLASNPERFAYHDRRWIPAARIEGDGRPLAEAMRLTVDRFGGPMPVEMLMREISLIQGVDINEVENAVRRLLSTDPTVVVTDTDHVVLVTWSFDATDESEARAFAINRVDAEEVGALAKKLGDFDWRQDNAAAKAIVKLGGANAKTLGAVAWRALNDQDPRAVLHYDGPRMFCEMIAAEGYVFGADGCLHSDADASKWVSAAVKLAEKLAPTVDVEDAAPIEVKPEDIKKVVKKINEADASVTAIKLLEDLYEITPSNKTFIDDLANMCDALKAEKNIWWVGEDRFRKPDSAPDFIFDVPELFQFEQTEFKGEDGDLIDVELTDDGLSSTLRKLLSHPLATDVLDEDVLSSQRIQPEKIRLVLKSIHRELGTFPMCQIPSGWLSTTPKIQELVFVDPNGNELQVWANHDARLIYNLIDWWYEQPVESGAVFTLSRTAKPNVFDFEWEDQTDPVVYISSQRMEELREVQSRGAELSTLDMLVEIMGHWPKGADFLTLLAEVNVVRRSTRRLVASILSSYQCFYQRSGSPVWHFDNKKVELGFDKTKKKFIKK